MTIMNRGHNRAHKAISMVSLVLLPTVASADNVLDYIRNYDLNDYALGMSVSVSQNPYTTANNSVIAYPYLSSFREASLTDDWLLISEGELGVRKITESGWVLGVTGRFQTLGLGSELTEELLGLDEKLWTIEAAPFFNFRRWPVQFRGKAFKEISGRHGGWTYEVGVSLPWEFSRGYIVPLVEWSHLDDTYTDYYYRVTPDEARPGRPPYQPGPADNYSATLRWGYQIAEKWQLSGSISYEVLDDVIVNSPIVDKESVWSGNIGLAYNANVFQSREYGPDTQRMPKYEIRVGYFQDNIDTKIFRNDENGNIGEIIDVEELLATSGKKGVLQLDAIWRINPYHRLEFGYFGLKRDSTVALQRELRLGSSIFERDSEVRATANIRIARAAYAFSIMNDAQKELGVMAGIHFSNVDAELVSTATGERHVTNASTPLPVVGLHGNVTLGEKTNLGARVHLYGMEFDHYEGSMLYITLALQYMFTQSASAGLGYNFYEMSLDSDHESINGTVEVRHHGPLLFLGIHF